MIKNCLGPMLRVVGIWLICIIILMVLKIDYHYAPWLTGVIVIAMEWEKFKD